MSSYSSPTLKNLTLSHKAGKKESKSMSNLKIIITGLSPAMNQVGEIRSHTDDGVSLLRTAREDKRVSLPPNALLSL